MNSREIVKSILEFNAKDRIACDFFRQEAGSDFWSTGPSPSPDDRPKSLAAASDEWGSIWENIGTSSIGEVKKYALTDWDDKDKLPLPDIKNPERWHHIKNARAEAGDRFLFGGGISIYERIHFIRGLEDTWTDIYEYPDELCWLLDILTDMNLYCIEKFKEADCDGFFTCDDWGLQDRLMINPDKFREIWKPRYAKIYEACHKAGIKTFLHSCGYIVDILDDLIDAGLDCIQMDQQKNMGLETLGKRFGGRISFYSPADIQAILPYANETELRAYCREMFNNLWHNGGFIPKLYSDMSGAGFSAESENIMCDEFLKIGKELFKK